MKPRVSDKPILISTGIGPIRCISGCCMQALLLAEQGEVMQCGRYRREVGALKLSSNEKLMVSVDMPESCTNNIVRVSAGASHAIALDGDGSSWSWGMNSSGQLGHGEFGRVEVPIPKK